MNDVLKAFILLVKNTHANHNAASPATTTTRRKNMPYKSNGINMLDVKKRNRASIINKIHHSRGISRKQLAAEIGLTPAAVTLISTDLINEGLISEKRSEQHTAGKGRKEVCLRLNASEYAVYGVYLSKHSFDVTCIDLDTNSLFEYSVDISSCNRSAELIVEKIAETICELHSRYDIEKNYKVLGLGLCIHGKVDTKNGVSLNSYGICEGNAPLSQMLSEKLGLPVLLTNNICALAHGELFTTMLDSSTLSDILFIKYGPGVGAAHISSTANMSISDYSAIELGHVIMDPLGAPCICGNRGCLETIVGYNSIVSAAREIFSAEQTPALYKLVDGHPELVDIENICEALDRGDKPLGDIMNKIGRAHV